MITTTRVGTTSTRILIVVGACAIVLSACGGGSSGSNSQSTTYNLQAGYASFITTGASANIALSGTVTSNGTSVAFTGTGTLAYSAAASTTFDNSPAESQVQAINATLTADGQSEPLMTSVSDFYAPTNDDLLGQSSTGSYEVAQSPISYPDSVVGGSTGTLGTLSVYADSTMSALQGTSQLSYAVSAPVDSGGPVSIAITNKIYDTSNNLVETDVTTFSLTTSNVLTFVSETAVTSTTNLTITAQ